ncbi:hypothetical protein P7K49_031793, partial [Saguinus oedipus]
PPRPQGREPQRLSEVLGAPFCQPEELRARSQEAGNMAGQSRNMAGQPAASGSPSPDRDGTEPNVVARISQWADDHLRLVWAGGGRRAIQSDPEKNMRPPSGILLGPRSCRELPGM